MEDQESLSWLVGLLGGCREGVVIQFSLRRCIFQNQIVETQNPISSLEIIDLTLEGEQPLSVIPSSDAAAAAKHLFSTGTGMSLSGTEGSTPFTGGPVTPTRKEAEGNGDPTLNVSVTSTVVSNLLLAYITL